MIFHNHERIESFDNPFASARPVSIPSKKQYRTNVPSDNISALLESTRIPTRHARTRRKFSVDVASPASSHRSTPRRRDSLFDLDSTTVSAQSVPGSYSYLLTPPNSVPILSRSYSTTSMESSISTSSSQYGRSPRRLSVQREQVDLSLENPLCVEEDEDSFEIDSPCASSPETTSPSRRSSLGLLLKPLKAVAPTMNPANMVSALTANLSSWAQSLSSTQYDDRYGLLPSASYMQPTSARPYTIPQNMPRPVKSSGPQQQHSTIIEAEMERPLLAEEVLRPIYVELQPWSKPVRDNLVQSVETSVMRPREPRMNPDFLRILVLETNMRRLGKISAGTGRARMILSPRLGESRPSQLRCA